MANESAKEIRAKIKLLVEEAGVQKKINATNKSALDNLRARLKTVRSLNDEEKKSLDSKFKMAKNEELLLKLATSEDKKYRDIGKTLEKQLQTNLKLVQGEQGMFGKLKLTLGLRKQQRKIDDITKQIADAKRYGLNDEVKKLEAVQKTLIANKKLQDDVLGIRGDTSDVETALQKKIEDTIPGLSSLKGKAQEFTKALAANPMAAIALAAVGLLALMGKMIKAAFELQKEFGLSLSSTIGLQTTLLKSSTTLKAFGVTAEEVKSIASALLTEFGEIDNITEHTLNTIGKMSGQLGIAGADAVKLLGAMEGVSSQSRDALLSQIESVGKLARASKVAPAKVMADMAANSELIALYASDNLDNLGKAAAQAAKLGINLGVVSKMAESLLDFESSIEATMEASMMLGRQINTDKARQLALAGDLDGLQREVMNQLGSEAEFQQMNVLQRQALAKAFGLSVEELSKMVREQEVLDSLTSDEMATRKKNAKLLTDLRQQFSDLLQSLTTALMPAFNALLEVVGYLSIALSPFIEGFKLLSPILGPIVKVLSVIVALVGVLAVVSWAAASPWIWIPLAIMGVIGLVALLVKKFKAVGEFFGKFFGGGGKATKTEGGGVAAAKPVSAAAGGIFTELTNVNVADAGKPEAVIPLDPAGIKVNHDDLLAKIDQLIAATNKVTGEVREMGVK